MNRLLLLISILLSLNIQAQKVSNSEKKWAWLGFERPEGVNPIVRPDTTSRFYCPMHNRAFAIASSVFKSLFDALTSYPDINFLAWRS